MNKHDTTFRKSYGITLETVVQRALRTFDKATPADLEYGASWYPEAGQQAADLAIASHRSKECCAAVISHLSPQLKWVRNVLAAHALLVDKEVIPGVLSRSVEKAQAAILRDEAGDPVDESTFGVKTLRFYRNIMGSHDDVTIDVWALRTVGLDDDKDLSAAGRYGALEHAYRLAARRRSVEPDTFQATAWVVTRGGHA